MEAAAGMLIHSTALRFIATACHISVNFLGHSVDTQGVIARTHRICIAYGCGLLLLTCDMVCVSETLMYPAKTAGPIEMASGTWGGP